MDIDAARARRQTPRPCFGCGSTDHLWRNCPRPKDVHAMSADEFEAIAAAMRDDELLDAHYKEIEDSGAKAEEDFGAPSA